MPRITLDGRDEATTFYVPGLPPITRYVLHSQRTKEDVMLSVHYDVPGRCTVKFKVKGDAWGDSRIRSQFDTAAVQRIVIKLMEQS